MADFYVDVLLGSSANSGASELLPKQYLSQATFAANNRVYCKRGQTHPVSNYRFLASGMTLTAYGTGNRPIIQKAAGGDAWIYVQNASDVTLSNFCIDGAGYTGDGLALTTTSVSHAISNITIQNVDCYGAYGSAGLVLNGLSSGSIRSILIQDSTFYANKNHGTLCSTDVSAVIYNRCTGYGNGTAVGAHNFSAWAASASPAPKDIRWQFCESRACVDFDGIEGTGIQADNNTSYCAVVGCYVHDNEGAGVAFNVSSRHTVMGSLLVDNGRPGLFLPDQGTDCSAFNNTISGNCTRETYTGEVYLFGGSSNFASKNNILKKSGYASVGLSLSPGSGVGSTSVNDCIYGYATASTNITASNTVTSDPLLDEAYRPNSSSPCINAGTLISDPPAYDLYGKQVIPTPTIGAIQIFPARSAIAARAASSRGALTRSASSMRAAYG